MFGCAEVQGSSFSTPTGVFLIVGHGRTRMLGCFSFSGTLANIVVVRFGLIVPVEVVHSEVTMTLILLEAFVHDERRRIQQSGSIDII